MTLARLTSLARDHMWFLASDISIFGFSLVAVPAHHEDLHRPRIDTQVHNVLDSWSLAAQRPKVWTVGQPSAAQAMSMHMARGAGPKHPRGRAGGLKARRWR